MRIIENIKSSHVVDRPFLDILVATTVMTTLAKANVINVDHAGTKDVCRSPSAAHDTITTNDAKKKFDESGNDPTSATSFYDIEETVQLQFR